MSYRPPRKPSAVSALASSLRVLVVYPAKPCNVHLRDQCIWTCLDRLNGMAGVW